MPTATLESATSELVAIALIQAILGQAGGVGTKLPGDTKTWAATGFVKLAGVGGSPNIYAPLRRPVLDVQAKWIAPTSKQPPWAKANALAERVLAGLWGRSGEPREVVLPAGYERAFVQAAYALTEPRRIGGDDSNIATFQFDLQIAWVGGGVG
jgi:hypothetical protein